MFEDEKREQNMYGNQNIENGEQEDIFAEPDVEIPKEAAYTGESAGQMNGSGNTGAGQVNGNGDVGVGQASYGGSQAGGNQPGTSDSLYRYSYTRQEQSAQSVNPHGAQPGDASYQERGYQTGESIQSGAASYQEREHQTGESGQPGDTSYQETEHQPGEQDSSYRYSYIPQDRDPQDRRSQGNGGKRQKPPKKKKGAGAYAKAIGCAVLCGVIIGGCIIGSYAIGKNVVPASTASVETTSAKLSTAESDDSSSEEETTTTASSSGSEYTVAQIAEQCSSSVVAITNKSVSEVQTMFGTYEQESEGSGSGVIISQTDTELLIATNYHVVEDADELTVCFMDSEDWIYSAQLKGTDSDNDLAVIAVTISDMDEEALSSISIATIGDSDSLQVGDNVVAIGNALGLGQSVTSGIISALDREVTIDDVTYTLLQTDAAINAGNSGGALFNMKGELVGINTAKFSSDSSSSSASIDNMGFAIPMSKAQSILEELMTQETKTKLSEDYGCLNITGYDVSDEAVSMYGIPAGVYVYSVVEGAAADQAGIEAGDIITELDGSSVDGISELKEKLQYYAAGETVEVTIQRSSGNSYEEMTLTVTLDNASEQDISAIEDSMTQDSQDSSTWESENSTESDSGLSQEYGFGR
ncbi:MAG: trypsin-like peptidase domain-containing protein [Lachnospiraceae bacterium]|nr:trypsin-like peptidase domain-containing protein [Lachnospiraceae bacterium]